jgi:hypothetical protein
VARRRVSSAITVYIDRFGFVDRRLDLIISRGQIRTLPEFEDATAWMQRYANEDGYVYPPIQGLSHKVEGTERLVSLHRIPATHEIRLFEALPDLTAGRYGEGGFIAHFLGFLLGWRSQFFDWWVDGRVPTSSHHDYFIPGSADVVSSCLDRARSRWASWPQRQRTVFLNALFLHNRTKVYQWDSERFLAEYQVLDAFYAVAKRCFGLKATTYRGRFKALCQRFELFSDDSIAKRISSLRDDLIHSALWADQVPGTAPEGAFLMPIWLHHFDQRLGLAMLGLDGQYVRSNWQSIVWSAFVPNC